MSKENTTYHTFFQSGMELDSDPYDYQVRLAGVDQGTNLRILTRDSILSQGRHDTRPVLEPKALPNQSQPSSRIRPKIARQPLPSLTFCPMVRLPFFEVTSEPKARQKFGTQLSAAGWRPTPPPLHVGCSVLRQSLTYQNHQNILLIT